MLCFILLACWSCVFLMTGRLPKLRVQNQNRLSNRRCRRVWSLQCIETAHSHDSMLCTNFSKQFPYRLLMICHPEKTGSVFAGSWIPESARSVALWDRPWSWFRTKTGDGDMSSLCRLQSCIATTVAIFGTMPPVKTGWLVLKNVQKSSKTPN